MSNKKELQARLDSLGIEYDKRLGVDKLEALLNESSELEGGFEFDEDAFDQQAIELATKEALCSAEQVISTYLDGDFKNRIAQIEKLVAEGRAHAIEQFRDGNISAANWRGLFRSLESTIRLNKPKR